MVKEIHLFTKMFKKNRKRDTPFYQIFKNKNRVVYSLYVYILLVILRFFQKNVCVFSLILRFFSKNVRIFLLSCVLISYPAFFSKKRLHFPVILCFISYPAFYLLSCVLSLILRFFSKNVCRITKRVVYMTHMIDNYMSHYISH